MRPITPFIQPFELVPRNKAKASCLLSVVAGVALGTSAHLHAQQKQPDVTQLYQEAKAAEAAGHQDEAIGKYQLMIRSAPGLAAAHSNLGHLYYQAGKLDQALPELLRACQLDKTIEPPRALLGFTYYQLRRFDDAAAQLKIAVSLNPKDQIARLFLARSYLETGHLELAQAALEEARKQDPKNPEILFTLGSLYSNLASSAFSTIQAVAPDSYLIEVLLAKASAAAEHYSDAAEHYAKAIQRAPQNADLYYQYGHALWINSNEPAALEAYRHALELNPYDYRASWEIARILLPQNPGEAIQLVTDALKVDPNLPEALKIRGQAFLATSQTEPAINDLKQSIALDPDDATTHFQLARAYRQAGLADQAKEEDAIYRKLQNAINNPQARQ
jgi:superkiller protein 3